MNFVAGDVIRLEYKWPHQKDRPEGNKLRACVVVQMLDGKVIASPMSTVPPDAETAPYAVPVSAALQRQLGLSDTKQSWIYTNHFNLIKPPNPAIHQPPNKKGWTYGKIPAGMLKLMSDKRKAAITNKHQHLATIKPDPMMDRYRSSNLQEEGPRLLPGQPGNNEARLASVQAAATRRKTLGISEPKPARVAELAR